MTVVVWITEGTWPTCVDAARTRVPAGAEVVLLYVAGAEVAGAAHGAFAGLLGRGHPAPHHPAPHHPGAGWGSDPGDRMEELASATGEDLLRAAAERLGRPCTVRVAHGRPEREVVAAADGADLLVLARDGSRTHRGPHSLGPATRYVVDHAPCPVLLLWPDPAP
ncbi:universal stress protein [Kitasatospora sp. NPDC048365]|uniref:universal stress protein n=1 Tax=Kitasatospora sp. NPDC048365 TaxID=3364050 RepID=UPI0037178FDC